MSATTLTTHGMNGSCAFGVQSIPSEMSVVEQQEVEQPDPLVRQVQLVRVERGQQDQRVRLELRVQLGLQVPQEPQARRALLAMLAPRVIPALREQLVQQGLLELPVQQGRPEQPDLAQQALRVPRGPLDQG